MRSKDGHRDINFRYVVAPSFALPTKIKPLDYTVDEVYSLLRHGERDADRTIYELLYETDEEITRRMNGPLEMRFYNKERQAKYEAKTRATFASFISKEKQKV